VSRTGGRNFRSGEGGGDQKEGINKWADHTIGVRGCSREKGLGELKEMGPPKLGLVGEETKEEYSPFPKFHELRDF